MFTGNEEDNRSDKGDGHRQQKHRGGMFQKWDEYIGWGHVDQPAQCADGMLVKRPLLVGDDFVLIGFKEEEWEAAA